MIERSLSILFRQAYAGANRQPNEDSYEVWKRVLGPLEERDVRQALDVWQSDLTEVLVFEQLVPRGATLPTPAQLLALVNKVKRQKSAGDHFTACGLDGCSDGLKLNFRDGRRFVTDCWCLAEWKAAKGPIRPAPTVDRSFASMVSQIRRVN